MFAVLSQFSCPIWCFQSGQRGLTPKSKYLVNSILATTSREYTGNWKNLYLGTERRRWGTLHRVGHNVYNKSCAKQRQVPEKRIAVQYPDRGENMTVVNPMPGASQGAEFPRMYEKHQDKRLGLGLGLG